eukprot:TRINITY_DN5120_c0_g1_i1.p1 TRINITY_DN5120_c0_g1~~TRINITY_DN5120_c0_g1_i1.p1  ORF type:complete len:443 (+),score=90.32 TRINITY_DN5120_c0_g1_i1:48-1376(+)
MARTAASLVEFCIFNTSYGKKEGQEHEKVLFFFPKTASVDDQCRSVGLSEGVINFSRTFSQDKVAEVLKTEKTKKVFFSPEQDIWMSMAVSNPSERINEAGQVKLVYDESELNDATLMAMLRDSYHIFRFFNGSLESVLSKTSLDGLKGTLDEFFLKHLSLLSFDGLDLSAALDGVHFLPVHKQIYLTIHCFINLLETTFMQIQSCCFFYNDHVVWSGLEQYDLRLLFKYILRNTGLNEKRIDSAPTSPLGLVRTASSVSTGSMDSTTSASVTSAPKVFVGAECKEYNLVVFEYAKVVLTFLMPSEQMSDASLMKRIQTTLQREIPPIIQLINRQPVKAPEELYRYLYFNHMNLAFKSSFKKGQLSQEFIRLLNQMHDEFESKRDTVSEICVKTSTEGWIVGRKSDYREFYVVFDQKKGNLLDISEEVRKLSATQFHAIFMD